MSRDVNWCPLIETIPQPLGLADALKRRELKEKELLEPLLSTPQPPLPIPPSITQSLSITLPPTNSTSAPGSTTASNAPSPRPSVQSVSQASASTSKTAAGKPKRKLRQVNGGPAASVNGNGVSPSANASVNGNGAAAINKAAVNANAAPSAPPMPRRQSLREPKPRRRPDGQEVLPKPAPPPPSPSREPAEADSAPPTRGGKTRGTRGKSTRGRGRGGAAPAVSHSDPLTAPTRNGVGHNHLHANGNGTMVTRSRRGSAAVAQPSTPDAAPADMGSRPDDAKWHSPERGAGHFTGPGSVSLDSPAPAPFGGLGRNGLMDNPGRTIYSQQRPSTTSAP